MKIDEHAEELRAWSRRAQNLADALEWTEAVSRGEPHRFEKERCVELAKVRLSVGLSGRPRPPLGQPPVFDEAPTQTGSPAILRQTFVDAPPAEPMAFVECPTYRAKPGSPLLCAECLERRDLQAKVRALSSFTRAKVLKVLEDEKAAHVPGTPLGRGAIGALAHVIAMIERME